MRPERYRMCCLSFALILICGLGADFALAGERSITVDPDNSSWLIRKDGTPYFMCGPGDPEGFLYEGDQEKLIEKLARTGANSIYMQAVRSHGGDGNSSHNPFIGHDPKNGLDENVLDAWEKWFAAMDEAGITIFFIFYDDSACPWGNCKGGVGSSERAFIERIVTRFKHHDHLIWVVAEEYSEALSANHVSDVARIIKDADDRGHPVANHQLAGTVFDHADDANVDQFAVQYEAANRQAVHAQALEAWRNARGRYNVNMAEGGFAGIEKSEEARRRLWAAAMGGAYVMVYEWFIDDTPEERLRECGYMVDFFERSKLNIMSPHDELAAGSTQYVLAEPGEAYVAYTAAAEEPMGVRGLTPGSYTLRWLDTITGTTQGQTVSVTDSSSVWPIPGGIGREVALSVERSEDSAPGLECGLIKSGVAQPEGFGAPWNVLSGTKELLVSVSCATDTATLDVGSGAQNQYIYEFGYTYRAGAWQRLALSGVNKVSAWYVGRASARLPQTAAELSQNNYVVAYVCQWTPSTSSGQAGQWKCGCGDQACTRGLWQLQVFRRGAAAALGGSRTDSQGLLERRGNRLLYSGADAGRLVGANFFVYLSARDSLTDIKEDLQHLRDLGANYVRLVIHPGEWRAYGTAAMDRVEALATHAIDIGMFVSVDYHGIGKPGGEHESAGWEPSAVRPIYDSDLDLMRSFWREAARRFKDDGAVIFDFWDEPVDFDRGNATWEGQWKKFAPIWQEMINLVRTEGAPNLVTVSGDHWSRNLIGYDTQPLTDPQNNFTFRYHEFEGLEPQNADLFIGDKWQSYPILGTGWGFDSSFSSSPGGSWGAYERTYLDERFAGWAAWVYSTQARPHNILTKWDPPQLTPYGAYVRQKIQNEQVRTRP